MLSSTFRQKSLLEILILRIKVLKKLNLSLLTIHQAQILKTLKRLTARIRQMKGSIWRQLT